MYILNIIQLKVILVSLALLGFLDSQNKTREEYNLINFLACGLNEDTLINKNFLRWGIHNFYFSYETLNPKNKNFAGQKEKYDLDEIFDQNQRREIDEFFKSKHPSKVKSKLMKCKIELHKIKGFVPKKTIYSYSYPIISKGIDHELYGIIIESMSFEGNGSETLKVFKKRSDSWDLIYERLIAFS